MITLKCANCGKDTEKKRKHWRAICDTCQEGRRKAYYENFYNKVIADRYKALKKKQLTTSHVCECGKRIRLSPVELAMPIHPVVGNQSSSMRKSYSVPCAVCGLFIKRGMRSEFYLCYSCHQSGWTFEDLRKEISLGFRPKDEITRRNYIQSLSPTQNA